jgi:uncharacterized repeat protein (TIGR01451 family)
MDHRLVHFFTYAKVNNPAGVTANDLGDADSGPNHLQNFPTLLSATSAGENTTITGTLNSTANTTFEVEFFSNTACDASGFGEGENFLGSASLTTDASGNVAFTEAFPEQPGQFITATATHPTDGTSEFSQCIQVTPPVAVDADLAIAKADSPDPVTVGQTLTYTLTASNNGPANATGVTVTDTLPSGVTFVSATPSQGTCSGTTTVTCALGYLNNGASATVSIQVTPTAAGDLSNTASIHGSQTDPNQDNNSDTETTTVNAAIDLAITMTDSPDPVRVQQTLTYTLTVTNNGPSGATGVLVTDTLPNGVTFGNATPSQGTCNGTGTVICNLGSLATAPEATISIAVTPTQAGSLTNSAVVQANEPESNPANNSASETTTVSLSADVAITKTDDPDPVLVGQTLTYTLVASNNGPSAASNVVVTDDMPGGVSFVSATTTQGTCTGSTTVTCSVGSLASGGSATVTIRVTPLAAGTLTNTARVHATESDPNTGNDEATTTTTVNPSADVAITVADNPDPVKVKTELTYALTVRNNGPSPATGVTVNDSLPSGVTFGSVTTTQGSCTSSVSCTLGTLASGAAVTITIKVTPQTSGTLTNTATVAATENDPTASNNTATTTTAVTTSGTPFRLTVTAAGNGKVTSNPAGIDCGLGSTTCQAMYNNGTVVTLTATPAAGARFDHWEKGCTGTSPSCSVTVNSNISVRAVFKKQ